MDYKNIIVKFFSKEVTEAETAVLRSWLENDPANRIVFDKANKMWQESPSARHDFEIDKAWSELSLKHGLEKTGIKKVVVLKKDRYMRLVAAASIAILLAAGGFSLWLKDRRTSQRMLVASTIIQTREGEKASIYLADSTRVFMNSGTTLRYSSGYNVNDRLVELNGEAFFDVTTNKEMPFKVQLGKMTVSATGTRFNVLSYAGEDRIETTLEEGSIEALIDGNEAIDIAPGQQVVYYNKTGKAVVKNVATETYTSWKENKLRLIDTPLEEALRRIARRYNVTFEIRNSDILDLKYTATFIDESIDDLMQMLKTVSPIDYQICNRMTVDEKKYLKPRIIVEKRKTGN